jgi:hypothetical protein
MLPRLIKTDLNKRSHAAGLRHAQITRQRVEAALLAMRADGATVPDMLEKLDTFFKEPK